jgi:hypothetical protein
MATRPYPKALKSQQVGHPGEIWPSYQTGWCEYSQAISVTQNPTKIMAARDRTSCEYLGDANTSDEVENDISSVDRN